MVEFSSGAGCGGGGENRCTIRKSDAVRLSGGIEQVVGIVDHHLLQDLLQEHWRP